MYFFLKNGEKQELLSLIMPFFLESCVLLFHNPSLFIFLPSSIPLCLLFILCLLSTIQLHSSLLPFLLACSLSLHFSSRTLPFCMFPHLLVSLPCVPVHLLLFFHLAFAPLLFFPLLPFSLSTLRFSSPPATDSHVLSHLL